MSLRFALTDGDSQACIGDTGVPTTDCSQVTIGCDPVLGIRVLPPNDPTAPYISVCKPLIGAQNKLCSIAGVDLPEPTVPVSEQVLEVQMAIFPRSAVSTDPVTGDLVCPIVQFGANNLPVAVTCSDADATNCPAVPAVGGRAFYYPGDAKTVVKLGCTDPIQVQAMACSGENPIVVSASITDFDNQQPVSGSLAQRLTVSIGEPQPLGDVFVFGIPLSSKAELSLLAGASPAAWQGDINLSFSKATCLDVREDAPESTATLTCDEVMQPVGKRIDMTGVRLSKSKLDMIVAASHPLSFPAHGLVVGIVLDPLNTPLAGVTVVPSSAGTTVKYLDDMLSGTVTGGTSSKGIFVSDDAVFETRFTAQNSNLDMATGYGGLVEGKVTIVVIRFKAPSTGG